MSIKLCYIDQDVMMYSCAAQNLIFVCLQDMAAAMMYSADATRDVVGWYVRKLKRIDDRRREREEERKEMLEGEEKEDGDLGRGGL